MQVDNSHSLWALVGTAPPPEKPSPGKAFSPCTAPVSLHRRPQHTCRNCSQQNRRKPARREVVGFRAGVHALQQARAGVGRAAPVGRQAGH